MTIVLESEVEYKACRCCGLSKPITEFSRRKDRYLSSECKECYRRRSRTYYANNPRGPEKAFETRMRNVFGITVEDYNEMFEQQEGVCIICSQPETATDRWDKGKTRRMHVDHDHTTGEVRGLLCTRCNMGIGCLRDDPVLCEVAAAYLRVWKGPTR